MLRVLDRPRSSIETTFVWPGENKITVIVPAYQEAASIADTIHSLRNQLRPPDQIIVVDDCSTDGTAVVDHWRKQGRGGEVPIDEAEANLGELVDETDDGNLLQQSVATHLADMVTRLESPYREILILTELQDMKYIDAARSLGISLAAVKSRVLRGREMLRKALIRCCEIELGATGRLLDCIPRAQGVCELCDPTLRVTATAE